MYSREQLDVLTVDKLKNLAKYIEVLNIKSSMRKGEIIEAILEYTKPKEVVEDLPPMSVRVRRIYESQERK